MADDNPSLKDFGASFKGFLDQVAAQGADEEPMFANRLRVHFGAPATEFPVIEEKFKSADRPNLQTAIDTYLAQGSRTFELIGVSAGQGRFMGIQLAELVAPSSGGFMGQAAPFVGPVQYLNVALGGGEVLACVQCGLYLITEGERRMAALVGGGRDFGFGGKEHKVEIIASTREEGERFATCAR